MTNASALVNQATPSLNMPAYYTSVNSKFLISLYGIIGLCTFIVILDNLFWDKAVHAFLPSNPAALIWWGVIFNFPHIVSSLITMADREYIHHYRKPFSRALAAIVTLVLTVNVLIPYFTPQAVVFTVYALFFGFFATYTMYHVLSQQFGLSVMLMGAGAGTKLYEYWRRTATLAATALYMLIFAKTNLETVPVGIFNVYQIVMTVAAGLLLMTSLLGFKLAKGSKRKIGTYMVYSNVVMLLAMFVFLLLDYRAMVIMIPRFVHDITAFTIYSVHDQNRNRIVRPNWFYRLLPLPPMILCPIFAIVLANMIECGNYFLDFSLGFDPSKSSECNLRHFYAPTVEDPLPRSMQVGAQVFYITSLFHYYMEGKVWKRDAIHRHSVRFS